MEIGLGTLFVLFTQFFSFIFLFFAFKVLLSAGGKWRNGTTRGRCQCGRMEIGKRGLQMDGEWSRHTTGRHSAHRHSRRAFPTAAYLFTRSSLSPVSLSCARSLSLLSLAWFSIFRHRQQQKTRSMHSDHSLALHLLRIVYCCL